jgi:hypothetical protein
VTHRQPRNDTFARFGGREYRSTEIAADGTVRLFHDGTTPPADPRFTKHPHGEVWVLRVPAAECERVVQVSTVARFGRYFCQVDSIAEDGGASLYFLRDVDGTSDRPAGFEQVGQHEFRTTAPVTELHDYHETHRDLLFDHWRAGVVR